MEANTPDNAERIKIFWQCRDEYAQETTRLIQGAGFVVGTGSDAIDD